MCGLLGLFGYLGFLDETEGDILNNFAQSGGRIVSFARFLLAMVSLTQSPLALRKTRILAMDPAKWLQPPTHPHPQQNKPLIRLAPSSLGADDDFHLSNGEFRGSTRDPRCHVR